MDSGPFGVQNLIVIICVSSFMILLCGCLIPLRFRKRYNRLKLIPQNVMPYLRRGDLSRHFRNYILGELVKSNDIYVSLQPKITEDCKILNLKNHMGYGLMENNKIVHFKSAISSSYWYLESASTEADPQLKRKPTMTVREYVSYLLRKYPELDRNLCSDYVYSYERARFDKNEFTLEEWTEFVNKFQLLLEFFVKLKEKNSSLRSHNNSASKKEFPSSFSTSKLAQKEEITDLESTSQEDEESEKKQEDLEEFTPKELSPVSRRNRKKKKKV